MTSLDFNNPILNSVTVQPYVGGDTNVPAGDTDWQDEVTRAGMNTKVNLSASGGQKGITYFASGEYFNDLSPIEGASLTRYSGRLNINAKTNDFAWFGANINLAYTDQSGPQAGAMYANPMRTGSYLPPVIPVKNSDGSYN